MNTLQYKSSARFILFCIVSFAVLVSQPARAETTNCTAITSIPTVITTQGVYCFTGHLSTSMNTGNALEIQASNVTIDMNGFKLGGLAAGDSTEAIGIYAHQRKNIVIHNGILRGFFEGILLTDVTPFTTSQGHLIENILIDQSTRAGIEVRGRGITIQHNQVVDTGGTTLNPHAYGIIVNGPGNRVLNNDVNTTVATSGSDGWAYGIQIIGADSCIVQHNRVTDTLADGTGYGNGIFLTNADAVATRDNTIINATRAIIYTFAASGVYKDNLADRISSAKYSGGTDGGGNF